MKFSIKLEYNQYVAMALVAAILLVLNLIALKQYVRFDLTQDQKYSISKVSKASVDDLEDEVLVKVFFSTQLPPEFIPIATHVRDLLSEYESHSKGKLVVQYLDPGLDEELKREVQELGIPEVQMNVLNKDKLQVQSGYMGLTLFYADKHENLPIISRKNLANFEYDFTAALKRLLADELKTVGFLRGHGEHGFSQFPEKGQEASQDYKQVVQFLSQLYKIRSVSLEEGQPIEGIDTLIIAGPKERLSERELFEIDQFIMNSGRVIFLVDQLENTRGLTLTPVESGLADLIRHYGVKVGRDLVLDVLHETVPFSSGGYQFWVPYPYWPKLTAAHFDQESPIVNGLESISMPWVSSLDYNESSAQEGVKIKMLAQTTPQGWIQNDFSVDPNREFDITEEQRKQIGVVALLEGSFQSYFKGRPVPALVEENEEGEITEVLGSAEGREVKERTQEPTQLIVVGDSDFIGDAMVGNYRSNLVLFLNAVDYLTLDSQLSQIRSKRITSRPLDELTESKKRLIKFVAIFAPSLLLVLCGLVRWFLQSRKKKNLKTNA